MSDLKLLLTKKTELHSKYDAGCTLCPPDRAMVRKLACGEFKVTQATLAGMGVEREATVCDDCIKEMRADDQVEVVGCD
jgi:hypothetical protein